MSSEGVYTRITVQTAFGEVVAKLALGGCNKDQATNLVRAIGGALNSGCVVEEVYPSGSIKRYMVQTTTTMLP